MTPCSSLFEVRYLEKNPVDEYLVRLHVKNIIFNRLADIFKYLTFRRKTLNLTSQYTPKAQILQNTRLNVSIHQQIISNSMCNYEH